MNSPPQDKCPKCDATLAGGLCRQCLLLAGLGGAPASASGSWTPPTPEELEAQLPKYRVQEFIGQGGMGAVYKGWQTSLERDVAIKVLPPSLTEEDFTARFKQEARTMARLSHPTIVSVYDFDETADGLCYIVMEYVEGTDVQRMIASEGKLPVDHALAISINVCGALSYAHEHGIVHRDIKPANVMVDTEGRVKVADFGLAKVTQAGASHLTGTNVTLGTPGYIAPEVLTPDINLDGRADLYAVGVMLYAMLTGKVPHGRFEAASERVPGLDPRFDDIVNRAMQAEREARYANAAELRADLTKILTVPVDQANARFAKAATNARLRALATGGAPSSGARASSGGSRTKTHVALIGLAAAILAIGMFVWKPWVHPGGSPVAVPGVFPADQGGVGNASKNDAPPSEAHSLAIATIPSPNGLATPTTPAPTPRLSVPSTPVPSIPALSATPKPQTDVEKWFAQVDGPQEEAFQKQVAKMFTTGVASLRAHYLAALDSAISKASKANQLADALAWRTEKQAFEKAQNVAPDAADTPVGVKVLRADFRQQLATLDQDRTTRARALLAPYDAILAQNQTLLTERLRLDDALFLKKKRDEIALAWLGSLPPTTDGAAARPESAKPGSVLLAGKAQPFVNSLGMKFVPVPITGGPTTGQRVLFSIWDTRVQDYEVFAKGTQREWPKPDFPQGPTHPAVMVNWDDAQAFCKWLTSREHAAGRLPAESCYRLPSDHEWSCAADLGAKEDPAKWPAEKSRQINDVYPWGSEWPPPAGAGNYAGQELKAALASGKYGKDKGVITGYSDGFLNTSPVGHFAANRLGLFDMGGDVWQQCEDRFDKDHTGRSNRGASWRKYKRDNLLSSYRLPTRFGDHFDDIGFRCVLAPVSAAPPAATAPNLASTGAGAPSAFGPGQTIDLLALPDLDLGLAQGAHATVIHKEAGRLRIEGGKYNGYVRAPVAILGSEYELEVGVGKEFGGSVLTRIPLARGFVDVFFNSFGGVGFGTNQTAAAIIPRSNAWPADQPFTLKLRVKLGTGGLDDELEAKVGGRPSLVWHGRLADYRLESNPIPRPGLVIAGDVKTIESYTLRMIQGEAKLLPPAAPSSSPPAAPKSPTSAGVPVDFKFTAVDGREVDTAKLRGKVVLVDFWATWCAPCMGEVPHVVEAYRRFHDQGFEIVGISFDQDQAALQRVTGQNGITWPQYFDGKLWQNDYGVKYGIHSIPTMWLIDQQGRIATTNAREDLAGQVEKLLVGKTR